MMPRIPVAPRDPRRARGGSSVARAALALLLCGPFVGQALAQDEGRDPLAVETTAARQLVETLRLLRDPDHAPVTELAEPLESQAGRELELLWHVLATRTVPGIDDLPPQPLSEVQTELIVEAVRSVDGGLVDRVVEQGLASSTGLPARRAALELLGARGDPSTLRRLFALCAPPPEEPELTDAEEASPEPPPPPPVDRELLTPLRLALTRMMRVHPDAFTPLLSVQRELDAVRLGAVVRATGDAGDARGLGLLSEILSWQPELAASVMGQVRRLGAGPDPITNAELVERLYGYLDAERPAECRAAAMALAEFGDLTLLGDLIALLEEEDDGLRRTVHWSLQRLTGLSFGASHERWDHWYRSELAWMQRERPRAMQALRSQDPARVAKALASMLPHLLVRDELVVALGHRLRGRNSTVRVVICRALASLEHPGAETLLLECLRDPSSTVRNEAVMALSRRTGETLPRDPLQVLDLFEERRRANAGPILARR